MVGGPAIAYGAQRLPRAPVFGCNIKNFLHRDIDIKIIFAKQFLILKHMGSAKMVSYGKEPIGAASKLLKSHYGFALVLGKIGGGHKRQQVFVTRRVFYQKDNTPAPLLRDVEPDDWFYLGLAALFYKFDSPVHAAKVGERERLAPLFFCRGYKVGDFW